VIELKYIGFDNFLYVYYFKLKTWLNPNIQEFSITGW